MTIYDRDRKILWALAHNSCALCKRSLIEDASETDSESVVGDEAHIVAQSVKGPRAGLISAEKVDRYENLILLCKVHHKLVDDQPGKFTVEILRDMKRSHEEWAEKKFRAESDLAAADNRAGSAFFDHIPETDEEVKYVMGHRPQAWEYLMFAGLLQVGVSDVQHEAPPKRAPSLAFHTGEAVLGNISTSKDELQSVLNGIVSCFDPVFLSAAFGEPGRPGQYRLIYDFSSRLLSGYRALIKWGATVRETQVPPSARLLYELLSRLADRPMRDFENYVSHIASEGNQAARSFSLREGNNRVLMLDLTFHADAELFEEFLKELKRFRRAVSLFCIRQARANARNRGYRGAGALTG